MYILWSILEYPSNLEDPSVMNVDQTNLNDAKIEIIQKLSEWIGDVK